MIHDWILLRGWRPDGARDKMPLLEITEPLERVMDLKNSTAAHPSRLRRWSRRVGILGVIAILAWLASSYFVASLLTRRPQPPFGEPIPEVAWGRFAEVRLETTDGHAIGAWFIEGRADRPIVLFLHGNNGCRSRNLHEAEIAASAGCPVLMISFRAHGDSSGAVNDFGFTGRRDAIAAIAWLSEHHPGRRIVVWGQSLGAAAALFASAEIGERAAGYILECPYRDLKTAVRNRVGMMLPPVLDYVAYVGLVAVSPLFLPNVDDISPLNAAADMPKAIRVLILTGDADHHARPEEAEAIRARIGDRAECVVIGNGGHLQLARPDPTAYRRRIIDELTRHHP